MTLSVFLVLIAAALILGAAQALAYQRLNPCTKSFALTLALLPSVVALVILMVSGSIGAGVAVAGTFSLVRFRSAPGTAREIAAVFLSMALGLACGMGCPALALVFGLIVLAVQLLYAKIGFGENRKEEKLLSVTLPEGLEYAEIFDDLFTEFTIEAELLRVKTTNLGSLNRLTYRIVLRSKGTEKALIDAIRCRNGNLEISLSAQMNENEL